MPDSDPIQRKGLAILGSTGSIGTQALEIVRLFPNHFQITVLSAGSSTDALIRQALEFEPECVVIGNSDDRPDVAEALKGLNIEILSGEEGLVEAAAWPRTEIVLTALVGAVGLRPTVAAIRAGKRIALANKETLVVAGSIITGLAAEHDALLIPVDSEHSAIFQCLVGESSSAVESLILTASGGPFWSRPFETFSSITLDETLRHPTWTMGPKITVDSATMMNKGLEVVEAHWLFGVDANRIEVVVHPQSIVHSMVVFVDGAIKAQLGLPDMKVPIQYALCFPERRGAAHARIDWGVNSTLTFEPPDLGRFPCLQIAYDALRAGGAAPAIMNAANEQAVQLFLEQRIGYTDIPLLIERVLSELEDEHSVTIDDLMHADRRSRQRTKELAKVGVH